MVEVAKIRYIDSPDEKEFPNDAVAELVNVLNNVDTGNSWARHQMAMALRGTPEEPEIYEIDPMHWPIEQMCRFRDEGNTIIAKDGEKTVGMIGFQELHRAPNGQQVFEIRRTTVLENYRGQGIGRVLRESMIKRLATIDPDAILCSRIHTQNDVNKQLAESTLFKKVSYAHAKELGFSDDCIEGNRDTGYEFYICNLRDVQK